MKIRNVGDLITEAIELERKLAFIEFETGEDEAVLYLKQLTAMLETDSTTYNIDNLAEFVEVNTASITKEYERVNNGEEKPREYHELTYLVTAFNESWDEPNNKYADDEVAKRQDWLNFLDTQTKDGEITEEECETIAEAIE